MSEKEKNELNVKDVIKEAIDHFATYPAVKRRGPSKYIINDEDAAYYTPSEDSVTIGTRIVDWFADVLVKRLGISKETAVELAADVIVRHEVGHKLFDVERLKEYIESKLKNKIQADDEAIQGIAVRIANIFHDVTVNLFALSTIVSESALSSLAAFDENMAKALNDFISAFFDTHFEIITPSTVPAMIDALENVVQIDDKDELARELKEYLESGKINLFRMAYAMYDILDKHIVGGKIERPNRGKGKGGNAKKGKGSSKGSEKDDSGGQKGNAKSFGGDIKEKGGDGEEYRPRARKRKGSPLDKAMKEIIGKGKENRNQSTSKEVSTGSEGQVPWMLKRIKGEGVDVFEFIVSELATAEEEEEDELTYTRISGKELALRLDSLRRRITFRTKLVAKMQSSARKPVVIIIADVSPSVSTVSSAFVSIVADVLDSYSLIASVILFAVNATGILIDSTEEKGGEKLMRWIDSGSWKNKVGFGTVVSSTLSVMEEHLRAIKEKYGENELEVNVMILSDFIFMPGDAKEFIEGMKRLLKENDAVAESVIALMPEGSNEEIAATVLEGIESDRKEKYVVNFYPEGTFLVVKSD